MGAFEDKLAATLSTHVTRSCPDMDRIDVFGLTSEPLTRRHADDYERIVHATIEHIAREFYALGIERAAELPGLLQGQRENLRELAKRAREGSEDR